MSHELIAITMFATMLAMLLTGQRVFAAIGFVSAAAAALLYGTGAIEMPFNAAFKLFNWYPLLTLPLFIYMGYILSESGIADDLYRMFHVWMGRPEGRAGGRHHRPDGGDLGDERLSRSPAWRSARPSRCPRCCKRGYDKIMITGVIQAGILARNPRAAERRAGALRHDRAPAGQPAVARRRDSRA